LRPIPFPNRGFQSRAAQKRPGHGQASRPSQPGGMLPISYKECVEMQLGTVVPCHWSHLCNLEALPAQAASCITQEDLKPHICTGPRCLRRSFNKTTSDCASSYPSAHGTEIYRQQPARYVYSPVWCSCSPVRFPASASCAPSTQRAAAVTWRTVSIVSWPIASTADSDGTRLRHWNLSVY